MERELFMYLVSEGLSTEQRLSNIGHMKERVSFNIFRGIWSIIFNALMVAYSHGLVLDEQLLSSMITNTGAFVNDAYKGKDGLDRELLNNTMERLMYSDEIDETVKFSKVLNNYIIHWKQNQRTKLDKEVEKIGQGKAVNRYSREWKGSSDAREYRERRLKDIERVGRLNEEHSTRTIKDTKTGGSKALLGMLLNRQATDKDKFVSPYGIQELDEQLGGIKNKQLITLMAPTGGGKTRFSVNLGLQALVSGKNVLHISLEMEEADLYTCYVARDIKENHRKAQYVGTQDIADGTYTRTGMRYLEESAYNLTENTEYGNLRVIYPHERVEAKGENSLKAILKREYEDFKFDLVILDYLGLCSTAIGDAKYAQLREVATEFAHLCKTWDNGKGFAAICLNQISKTGALQICKGSYEGLEYQGADTTDLIKGSHVVLVLGRTQTQKDNDKMTVYIGKSRDTATPKDNKIEVNTSWEYCFFNN